MLTSGRTDNISLLAGQSAIVYLLKCCDQTSPKLWIFNYLGKTLFSKCIVLYIKEYTPFNFLLNPWLTTIS